mgnify:CR=1 FL=1
MITPTRTPQHIRIISDVESDQVLGLLQHAYKSDFPLVIRGGVSHWAASGLWSPSHLRAEIGRESWILLQSGVQEQEASPFINTTIGAFTDWLEYQQEQQEQQEQHEQQDQQDQQDQQEQQDQQDQQDQQEQQEQPDQNNKQHRETTYYLAEEFDFIEQHLGLVDELGIHDLDTFWETKDASGGSLFSFLNGLLNPFLDSNPHRSNSLESLEESDGFETAFWMGGAGAKTGWHVDHDYPLNVLCHLYGTKTLWIASTDQDQNMYPSNKYDPGAVLGNVNFWNPNYTLYPNYQQVKYEKVVLHPGDVLFIPMGYWHAAESMTYTASVSLRSMTTWYWFLNFPDRLLENLFFDGWWVPSHGSVAIEETVLKRTLLEL